MRTPRTGRIPQKAAARMADGASLLLRPHSDPTTDLKQRTCDLNESCETSMRTKGRVGRYRLTSRRSDADSHDKTTLYGPSGRAGERGAAPPPQQLRTPAANAPPAFPGEAAFRRIPAPLECAGPSPLRPRDYRLQKGGTTCTWPAQWFLFSISDPKKRWAQWDVPQDKAAGRSPVRSAAVTHWPGIQITGISGLKRPSTPPGRRVEPVDCFLGRAASQGPRARRAQGPPRLAPRGGTLGAAAFAAAAAAFRRAPVASATGRQGRRV